MPAPESLREEVRATVGARRELGDDFDAAVADRLVTRMAAEIDARVDERLAARRIAIRESHAARSRPRCRMSARRASQAGTWVNPSHPEVLSYLQSQLRMASTRA